MPRPEQWLKCEEKVPIDPISETLLGGIAERAEEEDRKTRKTGHWVSCPSCGRRVVKKQLVRKGCFVCGWKDGDKISAPYRTECPNCKRVVVTSELEERGCFICGWKQAG